MWRERGSTRKVDQHESLTRLWHSRLTRVCVGRGHALLGPLVRLPRRHVFLRLHQAAARAFFYLTPHSAGAALRWNKVWDRILVLRSKPGGDLRLGSCRVLRAPPLTISSARDSALSVTPPAHRQLIGTTCGGVNFPAKDTRQSHRRQLCLSQAARPLLCRAACWLLVVLALAACMRDTRRRGIMGGARRRRHQRVREE